MQRPRQNTDYWAPKIAYNIARDRRNDAALLEAGWRVIRAWEHDAPSAVAKRVETQVLAGRDRLRSG
jgi:DNA mismatch endonuclease (patch repair protein)